MSELTEHYRVLLGLDANWRVEQVDFSLEEKNVEIRLAHVGGSLCCPECGSSCPQADLAPERQWRHLARCLRDYSYAVSQHNRRLCELTDGRSASD